MVDQTQQETAGHDGNVVYLDPARFCGPAASGCQFPLAGIAAPQQAGPALHQIAVPAAMSMQMALQMYLAASGFGGTPSERATVAMMALARVTAQLLHELGAHAPEHQAKAMANMAENVRLYLELMRSPENRS